MKRIRISLTTALVALLVCGAVFASVAWQKAFNDLYKPKADSAIKKAGCKLCHTDMKGALNSYGKLLEGKKPDAATFKAIESKDADKDGASNIAEIKAGTLPGDPKSKPKTKPKC